METVPKRGATIRDVARKAGVGIGTVSRVLNKSSLVSDATRQRIQETIADLDFIPSTSARRLSLGKTLSIAAVVPFFTHPSAIERLRGIEETIAGSPYDLIIYNVETVERRDACMREVPRRERADGVIIQSLSPLEEDIPYLKQSDVPIVLVDANHPSLVGLNRVIVDDVAGGYKATRHLIELGHTRIGFISDILENPFNFTSSRHRLQGYQHALREAGLEIRPEYHGQGEHARYEARRLAVEMLRLPERPTAIFAASDVQAMGVLEAARLMELAVPDDLSVIGYDDVEVAEYLGLTTIRQLLFESGQRGVELLLEMLDGQPGEPVVEELPTELVERTTTAPPGKVA